jgi:gliding motility-associated-like protein
MKVRVYYIAFLWMLFNQLPSFAQYVPVPLTGFTQDAVAEAGPNSISTTTMAVDGGSSNKVMYTAAFRTFAAIGGGGLPDNGLFTIGTDTYQLAPYNGNNALYVKRSESFSLDLVTAAPYSGLRLVALSTEGTSLLNITLTFTDNTTAVFPNITLSDWFNGTANLIVQGIGRCDRSAGPVYNADGYSANPRIYYIPLTLACTDIAKPVRTITVANVTTAGTNAPFPNTVVLGLSGITYSRNVTSVITPSDCNGPNGSIALTVTGSSSPYTYSWNTTPAQTTATATGLAPGNYSCTITDAGGCISTNNGVVPLNNNAVITATAAPAAFCAGLSTTLTASATTGNMTSWTWTPGNLAGASVSVTPAGTTTYTVNAGNALGCTASTQVTVTVNPLPAAPVLSNVAVCPGNTATLNVQGPQAGIVYNWFTSATGGVSIATGPSYMVNNVTAPATYYVEAVNGSGCISNSRTAVNITLNTVPAAPVVNTIAVCPGTNATLQIQNPQTGFIYNWYTVASGGSPAGTGTGFTVNNVTAVTTIYAEAVNSTGCISATRQAVLITLIAQLPAPGPSLSNATFTSLTFSWNAVAGATGYEVSTNGGTTFTLPSTGLTGTSHTINGLTGNQTVSFQVRTLGTQPCERSAWSVPVGGTTLSTKEIFIPNVFTPNNDGKNDVLLVYGNYITSLQFRVFNQWGQLIFLSDQQSRGWDGSFKGQQQPVGVYAYTLKAVLPDGTVVNKKGSVNLIR